MRRVAAVALVSSLAVSAAPAQSAVAPYRANWWDAASVGAAGALYILPGALGLPRGAPACAPCDPATLPAIDRGTVGPVLSGWSLGSDAAVVAVLGWSALAEWRGLSRDARRGNVMTLANTAGWTAAATEWLKVLVNRNRPVLYTPDAAAVAGARDNRLSFPSAHTAVAFAVATTYLVMARRERLPHRTRNALLLYSGAAAAGALRIAAHKHFPTDVFGGAAIGVGIGWLVPTLHAKAR